MRNNRQFIVIIALGVALALVAVRTYRLSEPEFGPQSQGSTELFQAYEQKLSNIEASGVGEVVALLPDDLKGSRHQRFILRISAKQTVLVAHNIDIAPRIDGLRKGDAVAFVGVYEYNDKGGVIHWTHHDPRNRRTGGWLKHNGVTYR